MYGSSCIILVKSTRTHFYFSMKNNVGTEEDFKEDLLKVVDHYQVPGFLF